MIWNPNVKSMKFDLSWYQPKWHKKPLYFFSFSQPYDITHASHIKTHSCNQIKSYQSKYFKKMIWAQIWTVRKQSFWCWFLCFFGSDYGWNSLLIRMLISCGLLFSLSHKTDTIQITKQDYFINMIWIHTQQQQEKRIKPFR